MAKKVKVYWTSREKETVFARGAELYYTRQYSTVSKVLSRAQEDVLPVERRLSKGALTPGSTNGREFTVFLKLHPEPKQEPLPPPPAEQAVVEPPVEDLGESESSITLLLRALSKTIAEDIARMVVAQASTMLRQTIAELRTPLEEKSRAGGNSPGNRKLPKIVVYGVATAKEPAIKEAFRGRLDLRLLNQDQHQQMSTVAKSWKGPVVVMAKLVSHNVINTFKNHDLWRVNSYDELMSTLDLFTESSGAGNA